MRHASFLPLVAGPADEEDDTMFSIHCPTHGTEVLLPERRIVALRNTDRGIEVDWECWCGTRGSLRTGRHAARAAALV